MSFIGYFMMDSHDHKVIVVKRNTINSSYYDCRAYDGLEISIHESFLQKLLEEGLLSPIVPSSLKTGVKNGYSHDG